MFSVRLKLFRFLVKLVEVSVRCEFMLCSRLVVSW